MLVAVKTVERVASMGVDERDVAESSVDTRVKLGRCFAPVVAVLDIFLAAPSPVDASFTSLVLLLLLLLPSAGVGGLDDAVTFVDVLPAFAIVDQ